MYGKEAKLPLEVTADTPIEPPATFEDSLTNRMYSLLHKTIQARQDALMKIHHTQDKQKEYHDNKYTLQDQLKVDDLVLLYKSAHAQSKSDKLNPHWKGPYRIHQVFPNGTYKLYTEEGRSIKGVIHGNQLKLYKKPPFLEPVVEIL